MIEFTEQQLKDAKDKGEELYKSLGQVYYPYFKEKISFGAQGLEHLKFIAIMKRNRVRIIIKQIDDGQKFFWSIVPFWGMNTETMNRILHEGVPEED